MGEPQGEHGRALAQLLAPPDLEREIARLGSEPSVCLVCGAERFERLFRRSGKWCWRCRACELVFVHDIYPEFARDTEHLDGTYVFDSQVDTVYKALGGFFVLLAIFLYVPIAILMIFSFNDHRVISFPLRGFTFRWYEAMVANEQLLASLQVSAVVAAVSASYLELLRQVPGHAILRSVLPMALGLACVPRRGAGCVMGGTALGTATCLGLFGHGPGVGNLTSLALTGPLLDLALRRDPLHSLVRHERFEGSFLP